MRGQSWASGKSAIPVYSEALTSCAFRSLSLSRCNSSTTNGGNTWWMGANVGTCPDLKSFLENLLCTYKVMFKICKETSIAAVHISIVWISRDGTFVHPASSIIVLLHLHTKRPFKGRFWFSKARSNFDVFLFTTNFLWHSQISTDFKVSWSHLSLSSKHKGIYPRLSWNQHPAAFNCTENPSCLMWNQFSFTLKCRGNSTCLTLLSANSLSQS